jgi:hypothetical protein
MDKFFIATLVAILIGCLLLAGFILYRDAFYKKHPLGTRIERYFD